MTTLVVSGGRSAEQLWNSATYDTGFVSVALAPGAGHRGFPTLLADALAQTGRIQPSWSSWHRATQRNEIGRVEVGLRATGRDLVIHSAQRLQPLDLRLVATAAARAGVDMWLVLTGPVPHLTSASLERLAVVNVGEGLTLDRWMHRPTSDQRRSPWRCAVAFDDRAGDQPAPGCSAHQDAIGCVLAWSGHGIATGRLDISRVHARLADLLETKGSRRWLIAAHARDVTPWADAAAASLGLTTDQRNRLSIADCPPGATELTSDGTAVPIPDELRPVIAAQRAIRVADRFLPEDALLEISDGSWRRYLA